MRVRLNVGNISGWNFCIVFLSVFYLFTSTLDTFDLLQPISSISINEMHITEDMQNHNKSARKQVEEGGNFLEERMVFIKEITKHI